MNLREGVAGLVLLLLGIASATHAQTLTQPPSSSAPAPAPAPKPIPESQGGQQPSTAVYQDRVIEGLPPADLDAQAAAPYDRAGWPRFLRLETRLGTRPFDPERKPETAFGAYGLIDTPNHGALSIDASASAKTGSGTFTIRQRRLPLPAGWSADHELGVLSSPSAAIFRLPSRVYLPSATVRGASGEWSNQASGISLLASVGEPGQLESLPSSGFRGLGGRRTVLGAQWHLVGEQSNADAKAPATASSPYSLPGWTAAIQHETGSNLAISGASTEGPQTTGAQATLVALRHEANDYRIQAQLVASQTDTPASNSQGFWADSEWDEGPRTHGLSLYRLEPQLSWAGQSLPSNVQGATLRTRWRTRQWSAEGSVDWLQSVDGSAASGHYTSGSARWRLNSKSSVGAGMALRRFNGDAWSSYGDWRFQSNLGSSGLRLELAGGSTDQTRTQRVVYDQEWPVPFGWTLSTSLGAGRESVQGDEPDPSPSNSNDNRVNQTVWTAAISVNAPVTSLASLRSSLNTEQSSSGRRRHGLTLGGNWRLNNTWSIEGTLNRTLGRSTSTTSNTSTSSFASIDPLAPTATETTTDNDRSFYLVLRHQQQAGSLSVPLGGRASQGGGRIEGTVFFDANRSGTQEASETGAANVVIYLDNRYAVRTDAQGRFEFPFVGTGPRTVTIRNETLPLPWNVVDEGQAKVDVRLRETTTLFLPVQRAE